MVVLRDFNQFDQLSIKLRQCPIWSYIVRRTGYDQLIHTEFISGYLKQDQARVIGIIVTSEGTDDVVADMSVIVHIPFNRQP